MRHILTVAVVVGTAACATAQPDDTRDRPSPQTSSGRAAMPSDSYEREAGVPRDGRPMGLDTSFYPSALPERVPTFPDASPRGSEKRPSGRVNVRPGDVTMETYSAPGESRGDAVRSLRRNPAASDRGFAPESENIYRPDGAVPYQGPRARAGNSGGVSSDESPTKRGDSRSTYPASWNPQEFDHSTHRMNTALHSGQTESVLVETNSLRERAADLQSRSARMPINKRIEIPSIRKMIDEGSALVDEGCLTENENMARLGQEKINAARERLKSMEGESEPSATSRKPSNGSRSR